MWQAKCLLGAPWCTFPPFAHCCPQVGTLVNGVCYTGNMCGITFTATDGTTGTIVGAPGVGGGSSMPAAQAGCAKLLPTQAAVCALACRQALREQSLRLRGVLLGQGLSGRDVWAEVSSLPRPPMGMAGKDAVQGSVPICAACLPACALTVLAHCPPNRRCVKGVCLLGGCTTFSCWVGNSKNVCKLKLATTGGSTTPTSGCAVSAQRAMGESGVGGGGCRLVVPAGTDRAYHRRGPANRAPCAYSTLRCRTARPTPLCAAPTASAAALARAASSPWMTAASAPVPTTTAAKFGPVATSSIPRWQVAHTFLLQCPGGVVASPSPCCSKRSGTAQPAGRTLHLPPTQYGRTCSGASSCSGYVVDPVSHGGLAPPWLAASSWGWANTCWPDSTSAGGHMLTCQHPACCLPSHTLRCSTSMPRPQPTSRTAGTNTTRSQRASNEPSWAAAQHAAGTGTGVKSTPGARQLAR